MYGILDAISSGPVDARASKNSTMVCEECLIVFPELETICLRSVGKMIAKLYSQKKLNPLRKHSRIQGDACCKNE